MCDDGTPTITPGALDRFTRATFFPVQENDHYYSVCRYLERNPLRAHLAERAEPSQVESVHLVHATPVPWLTAGPLPAG